MTEHEATAAFRAARDLLFAYREDYEGAYARFRWPAFETFNWALDWFDAIAADNPAPALRIVEPDGSQLCRSFAELSLRSDQVASWLRSLGVRRGDRILLMLGNRVELWETFLAATKLGAVMIPTTTLLAVRGLRDRVARGGVRHVVTASEDTDRFAEIEGAYTRIAVGPAVPGWIAYADADAAPAEFVPDGVTRAGDPLLLYFTSGTTASPKLVEHSHVSYPVGHLSTMYWLGLRPGDVHLNVSSPGWGKHAWSSVFAPWNAEACVLVCNYTRFDAAWLLEQMSRYQVASFCAPPTVWRLLVQADLSVLASPPRNALSAGEPLTPEVIEQVRRAWRITVRDGYGQTETTLQVGNSPAAPVRAGSMGRPAPGYRVTLLDPETGRPAREGEICLDLDPRPLGLMTGYRDDPKLTTEVTAGGYYRTGDIGVRDDEGYITFVGRADDVFKASDYRISPFELESVLVRHEAVADAAVVPSFDAVRLAVPKAFVTLVAGWPPNEATARSIFAYCREHLAPYQRIRRLEFTSLPTTVSGKIRRIELRQSEPGGDARPPGEFRDEPGRAPSDAACLPGDGAGAGPRTR